MNLSEYLNKVSEGKSGACWMQDFEPQIIEAVKQWIEEKRQQEIDMYAPPILSVYDDLIKELETINVSNLKQTEDK